MLTTNLNIAIVAFKYFWVWNTIKLLYLFNTAVQRLKNIIMFPFNVSFVSLPQLLVMMLWTTQFGKILIISFHLCTVVDKLVWIFIICWCPTFLFVLPRLFFLTFANVIFEISGIAKKEDRVTDWNWCKCS